MIPPPASSGSREALDVEVIFHRFGEELRGFLRRRVADAATADDLLQGVWLKVQERLPSLRDTDRLAPWLYQIARHAVTDHYRRTRPAEELPPELEADAPLPDEPDLRATLAAFLEALPPEDREALQLTEYEGLTQRELAERLGISLSGAKSRVQRARARLREQLEQCCRFEFDRRGRVIDAVPRGPDACRTCE